MNQVIELSVLNTESPNKCGTMISLHNWKYYCFLISEDKQNKLGIISLQCNFKHGFKMFVVINVILFSGTKAN